MRSLPLKTALTILLAGAVAAMPTKAPGPTCSATRRTSRAIPMRTMREARSTVQPAEARKARKSGGGPSTLAARHYENVNYSCEPPVCFEMGFLLPCGRNQCSANARSSVSIISWQLAIRPNSHPLKSICPINLIAGSNERVYTRH